MKPGPGAALKYAGVRPSKGRGQNFLAQARVAERIVDAAALTTDTEVVEIGPGLGILSERITARPIRRLTMVELDSRLAARLRERFANDPRVQIIDHDFLDLELARIVAAPQVTIIGNLPFNVAGAILRKLCRYRTSIARMVLMFQREVAERIRATAGSANYGALSVYTALYWKIVAHFRVAAGSFYPKPAVDAEVLTFEPILAPFLADEEDAVLAAIDAAFSAPRKMVRNALARRLGTASDAVDAALAAASIAPSARAETLSTDDFVRLARTLAPLRNPHMSDHDA
jgi:16S rRNA (adenine1518-N6/adenine1519-N6)-dimethyltransferase